MPENPTNALVKTVQSPALARVSSQLALLDKLLTKPEEPFLIPYRKGDKWGFCDRDKNIVIDCVYDRTYTFCEGLACVEMGQKMGFINLKGEIAIDFCYDQPSQCYGLHLSDSTLATLFIHSGYFFSEGLACVRKNGKYGFIDHGGNLIIPFRYTDAHFFCEGLAGVEIDGKWGFVNHSGAEKIPLVYSGIRPFSEGLAVVEESGFIYSYIDRSNKLIMPPMYSFADNFHENIAIVREILPPEEQYAVDKNNIRELILPSFHWVGHFSEGLAGVSPIEEESSTRFGYINSSGIIQIPVEYDSAGHFSEGLACVSKNGKYGYINKHNEEIIPFVYEYANDFYKRLALIGSDIDGLQGYIDKSGVEYWDD